MTARKAPRLPAAPIDFNAMHDALEAGKSDEDVLKAAVVQPAEAPKPATPKKAAKASTTAKDADTATSTASGDA
tara:strand:- start:140 stop:361 length:222 start_codon:yes stop_codon:yes gene_type:complete